MPAWISVDVLALWARTPMCIGRMATGNADFLLLVMHILGLLNSGVKAKILCMSICKIQKGMEMKKLILKYKGCDDWSRPVYEFNGRLYVDVDPLKDSEPAIRTKYNNDFYGEPDEAVSKAVELEFVPHRATWD